MLRNEMESYVRIEGRHLKNLMYSYMGVKNWNHPYVINEWPLIQFSYIDMQSFKLQFLSSSRQFTNNTVNGGITSEPKT